MPFLCRITSSPLRHAILLIAMMCWNAMAQDDVSIELSAEHRDGTRTAIMQNRYLRATFNTLGGRLVSLLNRSSNRELVWDNGKSESGACKDQFPPMQFDFRDSQYAATILENTPEQCRLRLQSTDTGGKWKFLTITRIYTLRRNERLLACQIFLNNQTESMSSMQLEYWQHNFFGLKDEETRFFAPISTGVKRLVPSARENNHFHRNLIRGWLAMIGNSGTGIAVMPEFRRLNLAYAWWCRGNDPLDTLEWRLIPEQIKAGATLKTHCHLGILDGMKDLQGAGKAGAGYITLPKTPKADSLPIDITLLGFSNRHVNASVCISDKEYATIPLELTPSKTITVSAVLKDIAPGNHPLNVRILDARDNALLFDLMAPLAINASEKAVEFRPLQQRIKPPVNTEPWQFQPSAEIRTPHCRWLHGTERPPVLFLIPASGLRDALEMAQRMPLDSTIPTLFPQSWNMPWKTQCVLPAGSSQNGTDYLMKDFLRGKDYRAFVIGTEVRFPWDAPRMVWTSYPQKVREEILRRIRQGAGMVYINPDGEDQELKKILATLHQLDLKDSMDLSLAPFFSQTKIIGGTYGKGRIVILRYPVQGHIIPQGGGRTNLLQLLRHDHPYQEYQFAILCRLLHWSMGNDPVITKLSWKKQDLLLETNKPGTVTLDLFDRYATHVQTLTKTIRAGSNHLTLPPPRSGRNMVHVKIDNQDFAFASQIAVPQARILDIDLKPWFGKQETVRGSVRLSAAAAMPDFILDVTIADQTGRLVHRQQGTTFSWNQRLATVNRHTVTATLRQEGKIVDVRRKSFNLPEQFNATENFTNFLWASADTDPEYSIPYRWEADRRFGFNFIYAGSTAEAAFCNLMQLANVEIGSNWLGPGMFHSNRGLAEWQKTHDKKYLVRPTCPNNPNQWNPERGGKAAELFHNFGTRHVFQLGDEMSMTYYNSTWDLCFCDYCLKDFRRWLKKERYSSLEELNRDWATHFPAWKDVMPMTRIEVLMHGSVAPWVEHRLYMDYLFMRTLLQVRDNLRRTYPQAAVGPTGVNNPPHPYGGNWNFYNMSGLECASVYGVGRIPLSFNRDKRLIMQYRGYNNPPAQVTRSFWEGLIAGERGTNNWYEPIFVLPDLRESQVRQYYKKILWELRSGVGDLFYHSHKLTRTVAILHSQPALIANFIKQKKTDYYQKELSFAQALEDAGLPYRFIAPQELENGILKNFQALILPESSAMSDREVKAVIHFVENGGILVADYDAAIQTQHCTPRKVPALNHLFGVTTRRFSLRRVKQHNLPGFTITHAGMGVKTTDGIPLFKATTDRGETPLVVTRTCGRGQAILLNFVTSYNKTREHQQDMQWPELLTQLLRQTSPARARTNRPVMHGFFQNGNNLYVGLQPIPPRGDWMNMPLERLQELTFKAPLHTTWKGWLYDARKGRNLGYGQDFNVDLIPGDGTILALMPYEIKGIKITAPDMATRGKSLNLNAAVITSSQAGHHVLLMTVRKPDGTESLEYRTIKSTPAGKHDFCLPFAYNDPLGTWKITIKDAASGLSKTHDILLR